MFNMSIAKWLDKLFAQIQRMLETKCIVIFKSLVIFLKISEKQIEPSLVNFFFA